MNERMEEVVPALRNERAPVSSSVEDEVGRDVL